MLSFLLSFKTDWMGNLFLVMWKKWTLQPIDAAVATLSTFLLDADQKLGSTPTIANKRWNVVCRYVLVRSTLLQASNQSCRTWARGDLKAFFCPLPFLPTYPKSCLNNTWSFFDSHGSRVANNTAIAHCLHHGFKNRFCERTNVGVRRKVFVVSGYHPLLLLWLVAYNVLQLVSCCWSKSHCIGSTFFNAIKAHDIWTPLLPLTRVLHHP